MNFLTVITFMVSLVALTLTVLHVGVYIYHPNVAGFCLSLIGMSYSVVSIRASGWGMTSLAVKGAEGDWFYDSKTNWWDRQTKFCIYSWLVLLVELSAYIFY